MDIKKIKILNLVENLSESLSSYFSADFFQLLDRGSLDSYESIDYILVDSGEYAKNIAKDYATDENEIQTVCVGKVKDVRGFLLSNGRLVIDQSLAGSDLGVGILDRFFKDEDSIHLASSFSDVFKNTTEFVLTNHLQVGNHIDQVSYDAFENGFNLVSLRSFIDHSIYYLSYLRQADLAGIPFEFEYGHTSDFFAINIQTSVKNFVAEYILDSFGEVNSRDPLSYLVGVMNNSCDFLDITVMENPSKIIFTGIWNKNRSTEFSGLAFHNILTTSQVIKQVEKQLARYVPAMENQNNLELRQVELADKKLFGDIAQLITSLEVDSVLKQEPNLLQEIVDFTSEQFDLEFPDGSLTNLDAEDFNQILQNHPNQEMVASLTEADREHLIERAQKKEVLEAFSAEQERAKQERPDQKNESTVADEISNKIVQSVDFDNLETLMEGFSQPLPEFDVGDPFANVAEFTTQQMPGQDKPAAVVKPDEVSVLENLGVMAGTQMPGVDGGDPFATESFKPASTIKTENLPEGIQTITNPATGKPLHIMVDEKTGLPTPVSINPATGEITTLLPAAQINMPNISDDPFGGTMDSVSIAQNEVVSPTATSVDGDDLTELGKLGTNELAELGELGTIDGNQMPAIDGGDPFVAEEFKAPAPKEKNINLPPGVQEMVNPVTGEPMHIMIDAQTGLLAPVSLNSETGEVTPLLSATKNEDEFASLGELGTITGNQMPAIDDGDPFISEDFALKNVQEGEANKPPLASQKGTNPTDEIKPLAPAAQVNMPGLGDDPFAGTMDPIFVKQNKDEAQVTTSVVGDKLAHLGELGTIAGAQMPSIDGGDPFAVEKFKSEKENTDQFSTAITGATSDPAAAIEVLSNQFPENDFAQRISDFPSVEDFEQFVPGDFAAGLDPVQLMQGNGADIPEPTLIIGGDPDDATDPISVVRGGSDEADDFAQLISGFSGEEDNSNYFMNMGSGIIDTDTNASFIFSGSPEETTYNIEKMVANNLNTNAELNQLDPKVKAFVRQNSPQEIQKALENFSKEQGITPDKLNHSQMQAFAQNEMPQIMQRVMQDKEKIAGFERQLVTAPAIKPSDLMNDERIIKAHEQMQAQDILRVQKSALQEQPNNLLGVANGPREIVPEDFENQFKAKLQEKMLLMQKKMAEMEEEVGQARAQANNPPKAQQMQQVVQETVKESLSETLVNSNLTAQERAKKENEVVKGISKTLNIPEDQVKSIVKDINQRNTEKESQFIADNTQADESDITIIRDNSIAQYGGEFGSGSTSMAQTTLMSKLKQVEQENKKLKENMNALKLKTDTDQNVADKIKKVHEQVTVTDSEIENTKIKNDAKIVVPEAKIKIDEKEKQRILSKVTNGQTLSDDEKEKMTILFDSDQNTLKELQQQAERNIKRLQIEAEKKESLFKAELEKATKTVKAKEVVLDKAKETMKTALTKKEQEVATLRDQINNLSQKLGADESTTLAIQVKSLKKDNESLTKMTDVYKSKLKSMIKSLSENRSGDNSAQLAEENRNLKRMKTSLEQKTAEFEKKYEKIISENNNAGDLENTMRAELAKLKSEDRKSQGLIKTLKDQQALMIEKVRKAQDATAKASEKELQRQKTENLKLQTKIKGLRLRLKDSNSDSKAPNEKLLEKVLTQKFEMKIQKAQKEVEMAKSQSKQLQSKIKELSDKLSGSGAITTKVGKATGSPVEKRLEQNVKNMSSELSKVRNEAANQKKEVMMAKKQVTGLQNQVSTMKRELERAKRAAAIAAANAKKAA